MRRALTAGLLLMIATGATAAHAQVAGRQLLSWCEGAMGGSATATYDAFRCETYLQAVIDRETADGTDLSGCLGSAQPDAGDLMARILPVLREAADDGADRTTRPAQDIVGRWIGESCSGHGPPQPAQETAVPETASEAAPDPAIELAVWQATQRIAGSAARVRALEHYLESFPDGRFADLARLQIEDLRTEDSEPQTAGPPPAGAATARPQPDRPEADDAVAPPEPDPPADAATETAAAPREPAPEATPRAAPPAPDGYEDGLSRAERRRIQQALQDLDLYRRGIDGIFGRGTRQAIRGFQSAAGRPQTGRLTEEEAAMLLALTEEPPKPADDMTIARGVEGSITVRNTGSSAIVGIFAAPANSANWRSNRLRGSLLLPGMEFRVPLSDPGTCRYDLRVVDERNLSRDYWSLDACRHTRLSFGG